MKELIVAAEILEKTAAYLEAVEAEKTFAESTARQKVAEALKSRFAEVTGEYLDDAVVNKLASAEPDVLALVEKLAGNTETAVSLGGPGEAKDGTTAPTTKKEAMVAADDRFATWLNS